MQTLAELDRLAALVYGQPRDVVYRRHVSRRKEAPSRWSCWIEGDRAAGIGRDGASGEGAMLDLIRQFRALVNAGEKRKP